jgi:hypothetical protein
VSPLHSVRSAHWPLCAPCFCAALLQVVKAWDVNGDKELSEGEFIEHLGGFFRVCERLWHKEIQPIARTVFQRIANKTSTDRLIGVKLSVAELEAWLRQGAGTTSNASPSLKKRNAPDVSKKPRSKLPAVATYYVLQPSNQPAAVHHFVHSWHSPSLPTQRTHCALPLQLSRPPTPTLSPSVPALPYPASMLYPSMHPNRMMSSRQSSRMSSLSLPPSLHPSASSPSVLRARPVSRGEFAQDERRRAESRRGIESWQRRS